MSRVSRARQVAVAAAYGGGGLLGVGAAGVGVLAAQAIATRRIIGPRRTTAPYADGLYGPKRPGTSIRFVMLGDSGAAGLGVDSAQETLGALIARGIVTATSRPVRLVNVAEIGARSEDLDRQVTRALQIRPHVAVILIGGNDVTHLRRPQIAVRQLQQGISRLVEAGVQVVLGTCPDMGAAQPVRPPLRWLATRLSSTMAAAQTIVAVEAGARSVSLGDLLSPLFYADPDEMFAQDRFHPSAAGYAAAAEVLLPSVLDALGFAPQTERVPDERRGEVVLPVAVAAVTASDLLGTEVTPARVGGDDRGPRGRWAQVRHRIIRPILRAEAADAVDLAPQSPNPARKPPPASGAGEPGPRAEP